MGRQINFYMSEAVQAEFMEFLKQNKFLYVDYYVDKTVDPACNDVYMVYLYKETYGELVKKFDDRVYDNSQGPVIEYSKTTIRKDKKTIARGRLWMVDWYFDEAGNKVKKNELLTKDYEKLVRWVKKHVPYQEYEKKGYILKEYINDEVIELQKQGYIL